VIWDRFLKWDTEEATFTATGSYDLKPSEKTEGYLLAQVIAVVDSGEWDLSLYCYPEVDLGPVHLTTSRGMELELEGRPMLSADKGAHLEATMVSAGTLRVYFVFQRGAYQEVAETKSLMEVEKMLRKELLKSLKEWRKAPIAPEVLAPAPAVTAAPEAPTVATPQPNLLPLILLALAAGGG
jgi:hypothetical protein